MLGEVMKVGLALLCVFNIKMYQFFLFCIYSDVGKYKLTFVMILVLSKPLCFLLLCVSRLVIIKLNLLSFCYVLYNCHECCTFSCCNICYALLMLSLNHEIKIPKYYYLTI